MDPRNLTRNSPVGPSADDELLDPEVAEVVRRLKGDQTPEPDDVAEDAPDTEDAPETDADDTDDDSTEVEPETADGVEAELARLRADLAKAQELAQTYEKRFKHLQPRVQQEIEARRQAEARAMQAEQLAAAVQIAQLPEEEQALAIAQFQQAQSQRQLEFQRQMEQQVLVEVLKEHKIRELLSQYPMVSREDLEDFSDPTQMERYAQKVASLTKRNQRQARRASRRRRGADRFEQGGAPATPQKPPETFEEARKALARYRFVIE